MSSGVIIANKQGVVVSLDSAVTFHKKVVFDHANKVFLLDKNKNYVIGVIGLASLSGLPWGILIEEFAHVIKTKKQTFQTIEDLSAHFVKFITEQQKRFGFSKHEHDFVTKHVQEGLDFVAKGIKGSKKPLQEALESFLVNHQEELNKEYKLVPDYVIDEGVFIKNYSELAKQQFMAFFKTLKPESSEVGDKLSLLFLKTMIFSMQKGWYAERSLSEIVFAGYGEEEVTPVVVKLEIFGFFQGQVMVADNEVQKVADSSLITMPLAQKDVFDMFFNGLANHHMKTVVQLQDFMMKFIVQDAMKGGMSVEQSNSILEIYQKRKKFFQTGLVSIQRYERNKLDSIVSAPLDDLYELALSILKTTIVKRKFEMTAANRTVGGKVHSILLRKRHKPINKID
jgi:hypothetical protein